jgi:Winged helix DNA-binding domain
VAAALAGVHAQVMTSAELANGVVAGVWQQRRSGRRIDITVEPVVRLTAAQRADVGEQAERVAAIGEGTVRLEFGTVTSGPHA